MENMKFYGLLDFYPRKEEIKNNYDLLTIDEIIQYKMYVYSRPFEDEYIKDLMWEYLNGWQESFLELARRHGIKKRKNDKRQQKYKEEILNESQYNA